MMAWKTIGASLLAGFAIAASSYAQSATPITNREVVGQWGLTITPPPRRGSNGAVPPANSEKPEITLSITARAGGALGCLVDGDAAVCEIDDGNLVIAWLMDGARMTFTLGDRTRSGLAGTVRLGSRLLPFGSISLGSVDMARR